MNYNEAMPCAPEASKIELRMNELENFSIELSQLVSSLEARLQPVLQPESPAGCANGLEKVKEPFKSPIAGQLEILVERMRGDAGYIRSLMSRLEI